ncbi:MAG: hypothetical protein R2788_19885 [Saprospiraceae bacterium]
MEQWQTGWPEALLWQADYIEERLGKKNIFLPNKACGDPDKEKISDGVRLLFAGQPMVAAGLIKSMTS